MKFIKCFICIIIVVILTGCKNTKYYTCTMDIENTQQNYILKGTYKIYYDNKYVTKVEKEEKIISNDINVLNYFKESKSLEYNNFNDLYGGYTYTINNNEENLVINSTIDLKNVDISFMVKNNYLDKDYTISNRLTTTGLKYIYISKGAMCS